MLSTQAGAQETSGELCENSISPMNQTGTRIQSLQSEPSQMKTIQDSNMRALKSYEQQCIEELRISNALLYEQYKWVTPKDCSKESNPGFSIRQKFQWNNHGDQWVQKQASKIVLENHLR